MEENLEGNPEEKSLSKTDEMEGLVGVNGRGANGKELLLSGTSCFFGSRGTNADAASLVQATDIGRTHVRQTNPRKAGTELRATMSEAICVFVRRKDVKAGREKSKPNHAAIRLALSTYPPSGPSSPGPQVIRCPLFRWLRMFPSDRQFSWTFTFR